MNVEFLKLVRKLDDERWCEYIAEVEPDDQQYMTYQRWLCYKLERLEELVKHLEMELAE